MAVAGKVALVVAIIALLLGAFAYASIQPSIADDVCAVGEFLTSNYSCGTPAYPNVGIPSPVLHYTQSSSSKSLDMVSSNTISPDSGSIFYPEAYDYHSAFNTANLQYSAVPLTYGLVGYWPLMEGSGTSLYDLSHNNNTGTFGCTGASCVTPSFTASGCPFNVPECVSSRDSASTYSKISANNVLFSGTGAFTVVMNVRPSTFWGAGGWNFFTGGDGRPEGGVSNTPSGGKYEVTLVLSDGTNTYVCKTASVLGVGDSEQIVMGTSASLSSSSYFIDVNGTQLATSGCSPSGTNTFKTGGWIIMGGAPYGISGTWSFFSAYNYVLSQSLISELYASTIPNLEQSTGASMAVYGYYPQSPETVSSGGQYKSLGQTLTAGSTGTYWVDMGSPVSYQVNNGAVDYPMTTISGTSGTATCYMPQQGQTKEAICYLNAYKETSGTPQSYTYPTAFTYSPHMTTSLSNPGEYANSQTLSTYCENSGNTTTSGSEYFGCNSGLNAVYGKASSITPNLGNGESMFGYLQVVAAAAPGTGNSWVFTLYLAGGSTSATVTLSGSGASAGESGMVGPVGEGTTFAMQETTSGSPASTYVQIAYVIAPVFATTTATVLYLPNNMGNTLTGWIIVEGY
jgi:hypothetical protein